jgi:hypothetical protein
MKKYVLVLVVLVFSGISACLAESDIQGNKKEILLRLPLLSDKNAIYVSTALDTLDGIKSIEVCYQLNVMIIGYDSQKISDEASVVKFIDGLHINSTVEKIYSSDIPTIRRNYKVTHIHTKEN